MEGSGGLAPNQTSILALNPPRTSKAQRQWWACAMPEQESSVKRTSLGSTVLRHLNDGSRGVPPVRPLEGSSTSAARTEAAHKGKQGNKPALAPPTTTSLNKPRRSGKQSPTLKFVENDAGCLELLSDSDSPDATTKAHPLRPQNLPRTVSNAEASSSSSSLLSTAAASNRPPKRKVSGTLDTFLASQPKRTDSRSSPKRTKFRVNGVGSKTETAGRVPLTPKDKCNGVIDLTGDDSDQDDAHAALIQAPVASVATTSKPGYGSPLMPPNIGKGKGRADPAPCRDVAGTTQALLKAETKTRVDKGKGREIAAPPTAVPVIPSTKAQVQNSGPRSVADRLHTLPQQSQRTGDLIAAPKRTIQPLDSPPSTIALAQVSTPQVNHARPALQTHASNKAVLKAARSGSNSDQVFDATSAPYRLSMRQPGLKSPAERTWLDSLRAPAVAWPSNSSALNKSSSSALKPKVTTTAQPSTTPKHVSREQSFQDELVNLLNTSNAAGPSRLRQTARKTAVSYRSLSSSHSSSNDSLSPPPAAPVHDRADPLARFLIRQKNAAYSWRSVSPDEVTPSTSSASALKPETNTPGQLARPTARKSNRGLPSRGHRQGGKGAQNSSADESAEESSTSPISHRRASSRPSNDSGSTGRQTARKGGKRQQAQLPRAPVRPLTVTSSLQHVGSSTTPHGVTRAQFEANIRKSTPEDEAAPPIEIVNNVDDEPCPPTAGFVYSNELRHHPDVPPPMKRSLVSCDCEPRCDPKRPCSCLLRHHDFLDVLEDAQDFVYDGKGRVKRWDLPIFECNDKCGCDDTCRNRVVQNGRQCEVSIGKTPDKGWGIFAGARKIVKGTFLGIYAGEIITEAIAEQRGLKYDQTGSTYLYDLDFFHMRPRPGERAAKDWVAPFVVDAGETGNFTRYFNHSCAPNAAALPCYINEGNIDKPTIAFFAATDIEPFYEICFSYFGTIYDDDDEESSSAQQSGPMSNKGKNMPCLCGASNCRGKVFA
ncbi:hypothetical protein HGRIS_003187 [Hohenbuehelia grisea]|uniref:Uncharacterized protein n=1 Tax=Hohenbuehelia grisea TaxID=104357 RepID=A0ABR3JP31_9AGAR